MPAIIGAFCRPCFPLSTRVSLIACACLLRKVTRAEPKLTPDVTLPCSNYQTLSADASPDGDALQAFEWASNPPGKSCPVVLRCCLSLHCNDCKKQALPCRDGRTENACTAKEASIRCSSLSLMSVTWKHQTEEAGLLCEQATSQSHC